MLDLVGRIPTRPEALAYRADTPADRYVCKVQSLLDNPELAWYWGTVLDDKTKDVINAIQRRGTIKTPGPGVVLAEQDRRLKTAIEWAISDASKQVDPFK